MKENNISISENDLQEARAFAQAYNLVGDDHAAHERTLFVSRRIESFCLSLENSKNQDEVVRWRNLAHAAVIIFYVSTSHVTEDRPGGKSRLFANTLFQHGSAMSDQVLALAFRHGSFPDNIQPSLINASFEKEPLWIATMADFLTSDNGLPIGLEDRKKEISNGSSVWSKDELSTGWKNVVDSYYELRKMLGKNPEDIV